MSSYNIIGQLESIKVDPQVLKLLKGKRDYFVSFTLVRPENTSQSYETLIKLNDFDKDGDGVVDFRNVDVSKKEVFKGRIVIRSQLIIKVFSAKKKSKVWPVVKNLLKDAIIAGISFFTPAKIGGTIALAIGKSFTKSILSDDKVKKKVTDLGEIEVPDSLLLQRKQHAFPLISKKKILVGKEYTENPDDETQLVETRTYIRPGFGVAEVNISLITDLPNTVG